MAVKSDPLLGTDVAGYRIEALIGRGGMGVVYRAEHVKLGRKVALKLLAPELAGDERFRSRFLRESHLAASIDHPNIVPIYDAGEADGVLYIAMRFVDGEDLSRIRKREGALAPERAVELVSQVAGALDAAHARGLVHRDVKLDNILVATGDHAYLSDFGVTKTASSVTALTEAGRFLGTPEYVAPEQIRGEELDGRADLYSLGCVLFECLTGTTPFARDSQVGVIWAQLQQEPPAASRTRPGVPPALDGVVARALAKDPDDRYPSCESFGAAARAALGGRVERGQPVRKRRPGLTRGFGAAAAAAAVLAVASAAWLLAGRNDDGRGEATPAAGDAGADTALIAPGRSIGGIALGMSEEDVEDALGEPVALHEWTSRGNVGATATYPLHGAPFRVSYLDGEVVHLATRSDYYRTDTGLGVGVPAPDPLDPDEREEALRTGELVQLGPGLYSWRGLEHDGTRTFCASGLGGVTMFLVGGAGVAEVRVSAPEVVPDLLLGEPGIPPCGTRVRR